MQKKLDKELNLDKSMVYCLCGDGELQEGQIWEALMYAAANKIDNIISTIDYNKQQIDGSVKNVLDLGNLYDKLNSFGWTVKNIKNGNNIDEVIQVIQEAINGFKELRILGGEKIFLEKEKQKISFS